MRILFTAVPLAGHLYPMVPLMDAARAAGHDVIVLTGSTGTMLLPQFTVIEAGPSVAEAMAETATRMTGDDGRDPGAGAVEMFGGVRPDLGADKALGAVSELAIDLVVSEITDQLGPLVAAALGAARVVFLLSGPMPPQLMRAIEDRAEATFEAQGLTRTEPIATVDPFPLALLTPEERRDSAGRLAIRPGAYREAGTETPPLALPPGAAVALLSLGTSVDEPEIEKELIAGLVRAGLEVIVTGARVGAVVTTPEEHVHRVGFVPLDALLPHADLVLSAGGTGTILAALSYGVPLIVRPFLADQPWNAERLTRVGVAITATTSEDVEQAARAILDDGSYREKAAQIAKDIAMTADANDVLRELAVLTTQHDKSGNR